MRSYLMGGLALLLMTGLNAGAAPAPPQTADPSPTPVIASQADQATPEAPAAEPLLPCSDCHEQAAAFTTNPHARGRLLEGAVPNAVCESCHGNGNAHIEAGGDTSLITKPQGASGSDICLNCHNVATERRSFKLGVHANSETVNCLTCHSIHQAPPQALHLLARPQMQLCGTCHSPQAASFRNKPYAHRLGRGAMECSSCHDPHAQRGRDNLRLTRSGELPCLGCHTDKKGPYVFPHGAVSVGDCMNCHEQHGSTNPKRLKRARVSMLCLECHSPINGTTLGSQPPAFHNLLSPRYQNCTTCHVAIHGSNRSPQLFK